MSLTQFLRREALSEEQLRRLLAFSKDDPSMRDLHDVVILITNTGRIAFRSTCYAIRFSRVWRLETSLSVRTIVTLGRDGQSGPPVAGPPAHSCEFATIG